MELIESWDKFSLVLSFEIQKVEESHFCTMAVPEDDGS